MELVQIREQSGPRVRKELREISVWIEKAPQAAKIKGMYLIGLHNMLAKHGVRHNLETRIQNFSDYPLVDFMNLALDAAATLYPGVSLRQGLRQLGWLVIPTFASSVIGKVIMAAAGKNWELALNYVSRGYSASLKPGSATVNPLGPKHTQVQLRQVWNFGDTYQVGVIEGLMKWFEVRGAVNPTLLSLSNVDLDITWEAPVN